MATAAPAFDERVARLGVIRRLLVRPEIGALIGALVWACFPLEWHHRMRVGPGYFRPL